MTTGNTLILSALFPEAKAIARGLHLAPRPNNGQLFTWSNTTSEEATGGITLVNVGISAAHLSRASALLSSGPFSLLVLAGLAGGLHPSAKIADIIVAWPPSRPAPASPPYRLAPIHTATELIATAADKARLHSATGAVAVEMEAALISPLAAKHNLPFLHIRSISDDHTDEFDPAFLPLLDPEGKPLLSRALKLLARHPSKLKAMLHLQKTSKAALNALAKSLPKILADYHQGSASPD